MLTFFIGILIGIAILMAISWLIEQQSKGRMIMDIIPRPPRSERAYPQPNIIDDGDEYVASKLMEKGKVKTIPVKNLTRSKKVKVTVLKPTTQ